MEQEGEKLEKEWLNELNKTKEDTKKIFNKLNNKVFKNELNDMIFLKRKNILKKNLRWLLDNVL